ncbi:Co-chaperone Hsc20 [Macrolepiota fuliginosa MF-IS2]|uniref:Co-chaperone Hsc20 n=1 Tax=Macrolepiota fuliginosa MF-IS2 TaxID=1400762 RepID=A0A9P6CA52_9AGAR|nr:Co-chaperone Hsc20 [Macrolepiota fuliginosa MF-IS2]
MSAVRLSPVLCHALRRISASVNPRPRLLAQGHSTRPTTNPCFIHTSLPRFQNPPSASKTCPACSKPLPSPVPACTSCWNIFSLPPDVTHHELFGFSYEPNPFIVDPSAMKQRFRQAQAACHPDTWTSKGPNKQDIAQGLSARVNEAYQTLLRPLARAEYILSRNELPISEHDQVDDATFMMEIMEARELIEDAEEAGELVDLLEDNDGKINETVHQLEKLVGQKDWTGVKAAAIRLRYLEGIARAAKKWLGNH